VQDAILSKRALLGAVAGITVTTIPYSSFALTILSYVNPSGIPNFLASFFSSFPFFFYLLIENRINYKNTAC
jgi:hypothetical protein